MKKTRSKIFYGWFIAAFGFLVTATVQYASLNSLGLFLVPITEELHISRSAFAGITLISNIVGMIISPFAGKFLSHRNIRFIMAGGMSVTCLTIIAQGFATATIHFYLLAMIRGMTYVMSATLPLSLLMTRWFIMKRSSAMSIVFLGSSIGGIVFSPVITNWIEVFGWRKAYMIIGIGILILVVPLCLVIVQDDPVSKNLKPLTDAAAKGKAVKEKGIPLSLARKTPSFWILAVGLFFLIITVATIYHIPAFIVSIGYSASTAAWIVSLYNLSNVGGKLLLGIIFDRFGSRAGILFGMVNLLISFLFMVLLSYKSVFFVVIIMAVFYGLGSSSQVMFMPVLTTKIFGAKHYGEVYGMLTSFASCSMAINNLLISGIYDATKHYTTGWVICIIASVIATICFLGVTRPRRIV